MNRPLPVDRVSSLLVEYFVLSWRIVDFVGAFSENNS